MSLSAGVQRPECTGKIRSAPQLDATIVYQGGMVMLDTSGRAAPAAAGTSGAYCAGVALPRDSDLDRYDNSSSVTGHADGFLTVRYQEGVFGLKNDGSNPILSTTQPGTIVYAVDDQTVSLSSSSGTRPVAGRLVKLDSGLVGGPVAVEMSQAIGKQCAEQLAIDSPVGFLASGDFRTIKNVTGHNGAGACTATGAKVGDKVLLVSFAKVPSAVATTQAGCTAFEATITVADQIQQSGAADLHLEAFDVLLLSQS